MLGAHSLTTTAVLHLLLQLVPDQYNVKGDASQPFYVTTADEVGGCGLNRRLS